MRLTARLFLGVLAILSVGNLMAATVEVGTCLSGFTQFVTIQAAVTAAPAGSTVLVCPGIYPEQVVIAKSLTIRGVQTSTASGATITSPAGGVVQNTTSLATGNPIAAQVLVQGAASAGINVDLRNLTVDGSNNGIIGCSPNLMGIFYRNASGEATEVAVLNQSLGAGSTGCQSGLAIFAQSGGGGKSKVEVSDSVVEGYQKNGITGNEPGTWLEVTENSVVGQGPTTGAAENGIQIGFGASGKITENTAIDDVWAPDVVTDPGDAASGILIYASGGVRVSHNNVGNTQFGIAISTDPLSGFANGNTIDSNTVASTHLFDGIEVCGNDNRVEENTVNGSDRSGIHLDSSCTNPDSTTTGNHNAVKDNTINKACAGILVGSLTSSAANFIDDNRFFNVGTLILNADQCPALLAATALLQSSSVAQAPKLSSPVRP